ncbi:hypothetical protein I2I05_19495 [Hymenobacter sp. BT683]|uniref:Uncharacterized protein n=1 Tax=Hymenobacter jeongseonensis TaxID=2791027 RepID=A0ABS0IML8_9BACT|nr:hypothetical protein [Hymenobacter jeongseonensis]MBF9239586.1 hypothetical protein [Hymenobacter jeongseonensis]
MSCLPHCTEEEVEQLVIFELVVPVAAKVPAPRQPLEVAKMVLRQGSVTSTVPGKILTQLRANNTALGAAWCITATLAVPQPPRQLSGF